MLVLSRKRNQKIKIGENVMLTVVEVRNGVCRIGIDAPREISIQRTELLEREEKQPAA